jgi:uncharacterized glyoxalase superfamily protein PhnB
MSKVNPIPEGYHTVTPYFVVHDAARFIEFLKRAFQAEERYVLRHPDGSVWHAEMKIGTSPVMLGQANAQWKPRPSTMHLYVEDVDAAYRRAVAAGGKPLREPADQFFGDRSGAVEDAEGNHWYVASRKENLSDQEIEQRTKAAR